MAGNSSLYGYPFVQAMLAQSDCAYNIEVFLLYILVALVAVSL